MSILARHAERLPQITHWIRFIAVAVAFVFSNAVIDGGPVVPALFAVVVAFLAPTALLKPAGSVWQAVTPIRDRVTLWEDEVVFALSALSGLFIGLQIVSFGPVLTSIKLTLAAVLLATPIMVLRWAILRRYADAGSTKLQDLPPETIEALSVRPEHRRRTIQNVGAYAAAGAVNSGVVVLLLGFVLVVLQDRAFHWPTISASLCGGLLVSIALVVPTVAFGRLVLRGRSPSSGQAYAVGGTVILLGIMLLNYRIIMSPEFGAVAVAAAAGIMLIGYFAGGWALSRLYAERPTADVFA